MQVLAGLEPQEVFHFFEEISMVPRPSYKEEKISNYLVEFAKERGLEYYQDEYKNVIIIKEAASGYEDVEPVILQGHMDMVCEKEPQYEFDFENDPLKLRVDGDTISAEGTTLGGDDGIAIAYALAILDSHTIAHPRLEFICTVSEEVGMEGAIGLDVSMLKGKKLLNMDSEEEGILLVGCAGGCRAECMLPVVRESASGCEVTIEVSGLKGGHSGTEINRGRANSNLLMGRILLTLRNRFDYRIKELIGGNKDNAIPRESKAVILVSANEEELISEVGRLADAIQSEFSTSDPNIRVSVKKGTAGEAEVLTADATGKCAVLINLLPNGIERMSDDIEGLVETSLNLGVMHLEKDRLCLHYAVRSSVGTQKLYLKEKMNALVEYLGGNISFVGEYPAWEYRRESKLRDDMVRIFREMYGHEPQVEAIHAGLECGILAGKIDDLDAVSIGPDMSGVHTTDEKLSIVSVKRVWDYILQVLACK